MHGTAAEYGRLFVEQYRPFLPESDHHLLVEVGTGPDTTFAQMSKDFNLLYEGVDQLHSNDTADPYHLNFANNSADMVISSSCFEHDELFWVTYLEILRILKPHGLFYLNAPSNGPYHGYPGDCYRFYRDSAKALEKWGRISGYRVKTLEHFIGKTNDDPGDEAYWKDYVAIWVKDESFSFLYEKRIQDIAEGTEQGWRH